MSDMPVEQFATLLKLPVKALLSQLREAGVSVSDSELVTVLYSDSDTESDLDLNVVS